MALINVIIGIPTRIFGGTGFLFNTYKNIIGIDRKKDFTLLKLTIGQQNLTQLFEWIQLVCQPESLNTCQGTCVNGTRCLNKPIDGKYCRLHC